MRGYTFVLAATAAGFVGGASLLIAGPASADSPAQQCAAAGGDFVQGDGGEKTCQFPVGNSDNVKTVKQKGSFNSSHDESFVNPGGNEPAGKQGGNNIGK